MADYTIYGRPDCPYCAKAIAMLQAGNHDFDYIDIQEHGLSKQDISERIKQPVHTLPQILHRQHYVGGSTDLAAYLRDRPPK
ncbi:MAG: glutathione S-transferase N-terminal domain-containing protein [Cellvibrionales bacterium]|nr:glutathione S-transferase N-terminal domain-containing protein [Cellvibrionales bacterium]